MIKEILFGICNTVLSSILSYILTKCNISIELSICIGAIVFTVSFLIYFICAYIKLKKETKRLDALSGEKSSNENYAQVSNSKLAIRSTTAIIDFLNCATHDFFMTGIINNMGLNMFLNDKTVLEKCLNEGIKIHILFYVSDEEKNLNGI